MKNLSGTVKIVISGILGFSLAMAALLARTDTPQSPVYDNQKNGIRLHFGAGNRDWMQVDEGSLDAALKTVHDSCYHVDYAPSDGAHGPWPKGKLKYMEIVDIPIPKEIGGRMNDQHNGSGAPTQTTRDPRSTQLVTFQRVEDLKTFVDLLQSSGSPTPTPTVKPTP